MTAIAAMPLGALGTLILIALTAALAFRSRRRLARARTVPRR